MENIKILREQCKRIKQEQKFTNQYIVEMTGVSKATVDRFFSNQECGFQYETIQPIVKFLIQFDKPAEEAQVPIPNPDLIEMYKSIVETKNKSIDYLKNQIVEQENNYKAQLADMKRSRNLCRTLFIILMFGIIALFIVDASLYGRGWLNNPVQYSPTPVMEVTPEP